MSIERALSCHNVQLVVLDLDNTLYDWVDYFVESFYAMVDKAVEITGCDREQLLDDFREVHQRHGDSEHPFSLLETRTIREHFRSHTLLETAEALDAAFYAFNRARKKSLALYSGVRDGLNFFEKNNIAVVAHTESKLFAVVDRLIRLDIHKYFTKIYCRERSSSIHPHGQSASDWLERFPLHKVKELSGHQRKPDSQVLLEICRLEGALPSNTIYIGDSIARDILMARWAGVIAVWAKYGVSQEKDSYQKLARVSHWTEQDIAREINLKNKARDISPDLILEHSFNEIISRLERQKIHDRIGFYINIEQNKEHHFKKYASLKQT